MAKRFLTLDIGASSISLAEYSGAKGSLTLVKYGVAKLAAPIDTGNAEAILAPALLEIVREKGIKPGPVSIAVSGQMVFPRFASIAAAGGAEKFEQMIRYEIEQNIPFPSEEMICDSQVLGDNENGEKSVMIVAAKTEQIEELTNAVRGVGFMPALVDVAPIALTNALRRQLGADETCRVILDIGSKTTSLVIVEGDKIYNRSIPVAGNTITKDIATEFGCSFEDAEQAKCESGYVALGGVVEDEDETRDRISKVCRAVMTRLHAEITRSINFYRSQQRGGVPVKLYLTGGTALLPQIDRFFEENLNIEVEFFNPFGNIGIAPQVDSAALENDCAFLGVTAGLALHAADDAPFAINLLPPSLVRERADIARIPFVAGGSVGIVVAMVLAMLSVNNIAALSEAKRDAVQSRLNILRNFEAGVQKAEGEVKKELAEADALKALFDARGATVAKINAVRSALGSVMWIEKWDGDRVTIRGWADDLKELVAKSKNSGGGKSTAAEIVAERLKASNAVASVKTEEMTAIGKNGSLQQFTMTIKFGKKEEGK
jgi:type IV pilus assembly protein PilM